MKLINASCVPDEVISNVLQQFEPALARRNIEVEFSAAASAGVVLDSDALAQIIGNLISNVEKYAASGRWLGLETHESGENSSFGWPIGGRGFRIPSAS